MTDDLRVYGSDLAQAVAEALVVHLDHLLATCEVVDLAVAGGYVSTAVLAAVPTAGLDWSRIRVWWVDERFVPAGDPDRNDLAAADALFSRTPGVQLRPMPVDDGTPIEQARAAYEAQWQAEIGPRGLDLALLGMGPDGHVASLFPGHRQLDLTESDVLVELDSPKPPPRRLTLSLPALLRSASIWVAAAGEAKAPVLAHALGGGDYHDVPVAALRGQKTVWWLDRQAAADL